ncbi:(deoxy)nucleoside triphosphate pyrophosphohydrolase [Crassaminicella thermophila]|uniref:8-oxo-dGTP diphosphatase n=1 Tax=Crassaminicella thermophila TaxID=2599308 RepID=A0A5C0SHW5_CRATE|nr:(deoxy)nucleoside triphosphate pyrophosphohydrolase [Crassaminicella thermophila]QEK12798.1 (deoxy)nucleoside triphosphate pyrophosphohydrolase [Crassaminicella thermophila]
MKPLIVIAGIIRRDRKILIAQRYVKTENVFKWEFAGGKLEDEEAPKQCLEREIKEELDLDIQVKDIFKVVYHKYNDKTILLLCYLCDAVLGEPKAIECNDFKWVTIKELEKFTFTEADKPIVEKIIFVGEKIFEIDADNINQYNKV